MKRSFELVSLLSFLFLLYRLDRFKKCFFLHVATNDDDHVVKAIKFGVKLSYFLDVGFSAQIFQLATSFRLITASARIEQLISLIS